MEKFLKNRIKQLERLFKKEQNGANAAKLAAYREVLEEYNKHKGKTCLK